MELQAGKVHPIHPFATIDGEPDKGATIGPLTFDCPYVVDGPALDLTQATPGERIEVAASGLVNYSDGSQRTETFRVEVAVTAPPTPEPAPDTSTETPVTDPNPIQDPAPDPTQGAPATDTPAPAHDYGAGLSFD